MTVIDLDQVPNFVSMRLEGNTGVFSSELIPSIQTVARGGPTWEADYIFSALRGDGRAGLMATIAALRGQDNRLRAAVHDNPKRGTYGGTPQVAGASQTGFSLDVDGLAFNVTNWIRAGDYFDVIVNGDVELKLATADASSNGSGQLTLNFVPQLRASPLNNATIHVDDGVLGKPKGVFLLENSTVGWSSRPGEPSKVSAVTLRLIEDVFATQ